MATLTLPQPHPFTTIPFTTKERYRKKKLSKGDEGTWLEGEALCEASVKTLVSTGRSECGTFLQGERERDGTEGERGRALSFHGNLMDVHYVGQKS